MIYLENNNGTQQIFIPKNLNISINKTYDEGFQDGMEYQKGKLTDLNVTKNGVYTSENGYKQVNVEVPLDSEPCNLIELNGDVDETGLYGRFGYDDNVDGYSSVYIDARSYGDSRYQEGYNEGVNAGGGSCNLGKLKYNVDSDNNTVYAEPNGYDGFSSIEINATEFGRQKYEEGYEQGKSEGGSCNLMTINENISSVPSDCIIGYNSVDYGVDGFKEVFLNVSELLESKYQEGVESVANPTDYRFKAITVKCKEAGYIDVDRYYNPDKITSSYNSKSILILDDNLTEENYFHIYVKTDVYPYIIGSDIFGYKDEVYEVEMRHIEKIESGAMSNLTNLSKIVIKNINIVPNLIIEADAFANCTNLNLIEFDLQKGNTTKIIIDENAFRGCPENGTIRLESNFDTNLLPYPLSNWVVEIIDNE